MRNTRWLRRTLGTLYSVCQSENAKYDSTQRLLEEDAVEIYL